MPFDFVIAILATNLTPPLGLTLHRSNHGYSFAPLSHDEHIYTIDNEIWAHFESTAEHGIIYDFCPGESLVFDAARHERERHLLVALTDRGEFQATGMSEPENLVLLKKDAHPKFGGLVEMGFDVIDPSGLSALVNVGYSRADVDELENLEFKTNKYGLFDSIKAGYGFAEFASRVAREHAPFMPVKIFGR